MTTTTTRPNAYPANCIRCGTRIAAGAGNLARNTAGKWAADHNGDCPTPPAPAAAAAQRVNHDGIYRAPDGTIYKVQEARTTNGALYAKRLDVAACPIGTRCGHPTVTDDTGTHFHGHFTYAPGAIHTLAADMRLTLEEAAAFGKLYGVCCACGRDLTDETSIARGIGPICGGRF